MEVRLEAPAWATHLLSDLHDWKRSPLPVDSLVPFDIPDDAWFEYAWLDADGEVRAHPGGEPAGNPWTGAACVLRGPRYADHPDVAASDAPSAARLGRVRLESEEFETPRWHFHYSPTGPEGPRPVVYFQDGKAFWHWGRIGPLVDRLTEAGEIPAAHYVFIQPESRSREYVFHQPFRSFFLGELMPTIEAQLPCDGRRVLWGASLGALASADLALGRPDLFATVVAQSGAFLIAPDDKPIDPFAGGEWLLERFRAGEGRDIRWRLECGTLEWLLPAHHRLESALPAVGADHVTLTRNIGHNWANWRQGVPDALRWALG